MKIEAPMITCGILMVHVLHANEILLLVILTANAAVHFELTLCFHKPVKIWRIKRQIDMMRLLHVKVTPTACNHNYLSRTY